MFCFTVFRFLFNWVSSGGQFIQWRTCCFQSLRVSRRSHPPMSSQVISGNSFSWVRSPKNIRARTRGKPMIIVHSPGHSMGQCSTNSSQTKTRRSHSSQSQWPKLATELKDTNRHRDFNANGLEPVNTISLSPQHSFRLLTMMLNWGANPFSAEKFHWHLIRAGQSGMQAYFSSLEQ